MKEIKFGIGFATGRKSFRKVLNAYIKIWNETYKERSFDIKINLYLFIAYDLEYSNTQSTDYTNLSQEIVDAFDDIIFLGPKNIIRSLEPFVEHSSFTEKDLRGIFGSGYAGKRNAILYSALKQQVDYLLFLDDDEYPVVVTNNHNTCLWSGQHVLNTHLQEIRHADYTIGQHCGYISPIPQIRFNQVLSETDFRLFIEAISNDIVNWDTIHQLMLSGGVTYASTDILIHQNSEFVPLVNGCKFISGSNLCINLTQPERTFPFYNPPGARGEDTFLSTMLADRNVLSIPCYTFHDGFSTYRSLLEGVLPTKLESITSESPAIVSRFLKACIGWIRYKPLFIYLTRPDSYEKEMDNIQRTLEHILPKLALYFQNDNFQTIMNEFEKYKKNVKKHSLQLETAKSTWIKLIDYL